MKSPTSPARLALIAAFALLGSPAFADTLTWDNGAANGSWNITDLNWTGAATWNNATPDDSVFGATGVGTVTLADAITAGTITFNTAGYTIDTSTFGLTLNNGITATEGADIFGTAALTLGANNTWSVAATKTLTANLEVAGAFGLTKTGPGTLALSGTNSYAGGTFLADGSVVFGSATALGAGPLTLDNGGTGTSIAVFGIAATYGNPLTVAVGSTGLNTIRTTNATGTVRLDGPVGISAGTTLKLDNSGAASVLDIGTGVITGNGAVETTGISPGNLIFRGANTYSGGTLLSGSSIHVPALSSTGPDGSPTSGAFGTGTLTINNATFRSTTTADTTIGNTVTLAGNLSAINNSSEKNLTFAGPVTLTGTRTITSSVGSSVAGKSLIISGAIGDGGSGYGLIKEGAGNLTLSGTNTYTGDTTLNGGTVNLNNASGFGSGDVLVTGGTRINATKDLTYTNAIDVSATLTLQAPGADTVTGNTIFSGVLSGSGTINLVNSNSGNAQNNLDFTHTNNTFTGNVVGPASNADGADYFRFNSIGDGGTFTFNKSGNRGGVTYAGTSAIEFNARKIALGTSFANEVNGNNIPVNAFQNIGTGAVTFNSNLTPGAIAGNGTFYFDGTNTGNNTFAGIISNPTSGGNLSIGKWGTGKWILTRDNTYLGNVHVANGTLSITKIATSATPQPLGQGSLIRLGDRTTSGTLEFTGSTDSATDKQIRIGATVANAASHTGTGTILNNGDGTLSFTNTTFNTTITGITATRTLTIGGTNTGANEIQGKIQNNAAGGIVGLTKTGAGTWKLSGDNTYTGGTSISGGTLDVANVKGLGNSGTLSINAASTTRLSTDTAFGGVNPVYNLQMTSPGSYAGTIELNRATPGAVTGITHNFGTLLITLNGGGAATLNVTAGANAPTGGALDTIAFTSMSAGNNNTVTETLNPTGGIITIGSLTAFGNQMVTMNLSGTTAGNAITGVIGGTVNQNLVAISKNGASTWTISGASTYTGSVAINGGILAVNSIADAGTSALGLGTGLTLNGGTLSYTGASAATTTRAVTLTANSAIDLPNGSLSIGAGIAGGGFTLAKSNSGTLTLTGASDNTSLFLNVSGGIVDLDKSVGGVRAAAGISGVSAGATVRLTGAGGDQIYDGAFFVSTNGVNGLDGTLDVNGKNETTSNFNGGSTGVLDNTSGTPSTFTIGNQNVSSTFAGTIQNTAADLAINKIGSGTLTLSGASTYSGGTTVSAGTLTLNGSLADATMSVSNGATVNSTGTGTLTYKVNGLVADQVVNNGTFNLNGITVAVNATGDGLTEAEYVLVDATGGGTLSGTFAGLTGAPGYELDYDTPNQVKLVALPSDPYEAWAGGPGVAFDGDANGDGVSNGLAWMLGAADKDANALGLLPKVSENAGALVMDFTCLKLAGRGTATLSLQHSADVGIGDTWTTVAVPDSATTVGTVDFTVPTSNPDPDLVNLRATIPIGEALDGKLFGRLQAEKP